MRASRVIVEDSAHSRWRAAVRNIEFDSDNLNSIFRAVTALTGTGRNLLAIELDDPDAVLNVDAFWNPARAPFPPNTVGDKWYRVTACVDDLDSDDSGTYALLGTLTSPPGALPASIRVGGRVGRVQWDELVEIQDVMDAVYWWAEYGKLHPHMNWRPI